jgi:predicted ATP-grasp superfamily ATP-dependent carboligase
VLGVTRQLVGDARAGAKPWHYAGSIGPLDTSREVMAQLSSLGEVLSRRFKLRGLVGVDLVIARNRAWVLEINPRYSSSAEIVERVTKQSAIAAHVAACSGAAAKLTAITADTNSHGKLVLYAKQDVVITAEFHDWSMSRAAVDIDQCQLADIPSAGQVVTAGHPILTVFATGSEKDIDMDLGRRLAEVESRLYDTAS